MNDAEQFKTIYENSQKEIVCQMAGMPLEEFRKSNPCVYVKDGQLVSDIPLYGVCYVSHPFGGKKNNIVHAGKVSEKIQNVLGRKGTVLSPIHNFLWLAYRENGSDNGYWEDLLHCIQLLKVSNFLIMTGDWMNSLGCCAEYLYAVKHQIPVLFYIESDE